MATLSFEVHTDKENATAASIPRKTVKGLSAQPLGSRDQNKFPGPTPTIRKALHNVNQQIPITSSKGGSFAKNTSKGSAFCQSKPTLSVRPDNVENMSVNGFTKKVDGKKTPATVKKSIQGSAQMKKSSKSKSSRTKVKPDVEPIPHIDIPNDEEYDSDSIFPRNQRLSSYVDKLLMWRPPCLFGTIPDSEPEISDHEDDLVLCEEICEMPLNLAEVPDFPSPLDLPEDLVDIPPLDFDEDNVQRDTGRILSPEPLSDLSFNASLPLGALQMIPDDTSFTE